jgi:hypothetical protein
MEDFGVLARLSDLFCNSLQLSPSSQSTIQSTKSELEENALREGTLQGSGSCQMGINIGDRQLADFAR